MDMVEAGEVFSALSAESRLSALRLLAKAGREGMPSGDLAKKLDAAQNTISTQLLQLYQAGLVTKVRDGRNIIYRINQEKMAEIAKFLETIRK